MAREASAADGVRENFSTVMRKLERETSGPIEREVIPADRLSASKILSESAKKSADTEGEQGLGIIDDSITDVRSKTPSLSRKSQPLSRAPSQQREEDAKYVDSEEDAEPKAVDQPEVDDRLENRADERKTSVKIKSERSDARAKSFERVSNHQSINAVRKVSTREETNENEAPDQEPVDFRKSFPKAVDRFSAQVLNAIGVATPDDEAEGRRRTRVRKKRSEGARSSARARRRLGRSTYSDEIFGEATPVVSSPPPESRTMLPAEVVAPKAELYSPKNTPAQPPRSGAFVQKQSV